MDEFMRNIYFFFLFAVPVIIVWTTAKAVSVEKEYRGKVIMKGIMILAVVVLICLSPRIAARWGFGPLANQEASQQ